MIIQISLCCSAVAWICHAPMPKLISIGLCAVEIVEVDSQRQTESGKGKCTILKCMGRIIGERIYYPDNRQILEETRTGGGHENRTVRRFYPNGQVWYVDKYSEAMLVTSKTWKQNGDVLASSMFYAGNGILRRYNEDGKLILECPFVDGKRHGNVREWKADGSFSDKAYVRSVQEGWARSYYASGIRHIEAYWRGGQLHGYVSVAQDETGEIDPFESAYYVDGKKVQGADYARAAASDADLLKTWQPPKY
jgi:antitoxin component YwqK of YwqJK toxin-antitoxin module